MPAGPRIYNLFPLLCGTVRQWEEHLPRIAAMGFSWVYVNPFHYPGFSGSLYAVKDYYRINDLMRDGERPLEDSLASFCSKAEALGLAVIMDLVINHTSKDALLAREHPEWFLHEADGSLRSPRAIDPADARRITVWGDLAEIDTHDARHHAALGDYFGTMMAHFAACGIRGFRCDAAYLVPPALWSRLIEGVRAHYPQATFFAETLGCRLEQIGALHAAGFDYLFNSAKWWDFRSPWLLEQYNAFRHVAPSIAFPESHDTARLATELEPLGVHRDDARLVERAYRQRYLFAAVFSSGVMMPVGFEYGFRGRLDVVHTRPQHWETPLIDLCPFVAEVNRMRVAIPALNEEGAQRQIHLGSTAVACLLRRAQSGPGWVLSLFNTDLHQAHEVRLTGLDADVLVAREVTPCGGSGPLNVAAGDVVRLEAGAARIFINA
jgi:starch synthase (maltosyl-transferring)